MQPHVSYIQVGIQLRSGHSHVHCPLAMGTLFPAMKEERSRAPRIGAVCMEDILILGYLRLRNAEDGQASGAWSTGAADGMGRGHNQNTLNQAPTSLCI